MRKIEHLVEGLELPPNSKQWEVVLGLVKALIHQDVKGASEVRFGWVWHTARVFVPTMDSINRKVRGVIFRSNPVAMISYLHARYVLKQTRRYLVLTLEVIGGDE